jgi:hypothetical protein
MKAAKEYLLIPILLMFVMPIAMSRFHGPALSAGKHKTQNGAGGLKNAHAMGLRDFNGDNCRLNQS